MIQRIEASNFKCFKDISLEMSNLNLLSGINSMGKSTIIQMLLLLRQSYEQNALEKGIYLNGKYTNLGVGKDVLYTEAEENRIKMKISDESTMLSAEYDYNGMADFLKLLENIDINMVKDMNLFGSGFNYIAADRLGPQSSYENHITKSGNRNKSEIMESMRYTIYRRTSQKKLKIKIFFMMRNRVDDFKDR